ncbi:kinase-like domain-containing protein [Gigaspora rosea]|uniref:Kinase-like domain-containing protein n=1 Tax=Gigaspora rosea TaxID=44941 RepID=A0A397UB20_9GLOM|nr:kinase-like domain-containing protein [Gigaspora rosea]
MNQSEDLIQKCLNEERIQFYEYYRFEDFKLIGEGGFGKVYRATFRNNEISVAIKSFKSNVPIKEIVKELKLYRKVDIHSNIIRLLGVTKNKDNTDSSSTHYMLVLEYADSGTLRSYLQNNFNELSWKDKINFALQIASAVKYLHTEEIIHRDLHSKNILVHDKRIKLTDFGLSKRLDEATNSIPNFFGVLPYVDPQSFNKDRPFRFNKKSDIYSLGVLMWEISSGYPPFQAKPENYFALMINISNGDREIPVEGSPPEYIKIYTECWQHDPESRPDIQHVFSNLKNLNFDNGQVTNIITQNSNALKTQKSIRVNQDDQSRADIRLIIPDSVLKRNVTSSPSCYDLMGENEKKRLKLNKSLEIDSNNAITLKELCIAYRMMNKYEESLADLNKSLEIDPNDAIALSEREIDPNNAITFRERGATYRIMNRYKESLKDLNKSLKIDPNDAITLRESGATYRMKNRYEKSLTDLNKSLKINPNDVITLRERGATYFMMNRYKESLADLNKSLEIDPNNAITLKERGATYYRMNRYEESLADLNKSLEINPNDAITLCNRGITYCMMNRYKESLADLNKSLEIDPNDAIALREREKTYMMIHT